MSVLKTKTSVDLMPAVITQLEIIPAFVRLDLFPLLEWKVFTTVTTLHVKISMNVKTKTFVIKMQNASTYQAVMSVTVMLALDLTSLAIRSNVKISMNVNTKRFVVRMQHAKTHLEVIRASVVLALD